MALEQSYSQKQQQVQKLALTQELKQSIEILQYNYEDLKEYLENTELENPLIEVVEKQGGEIATGTVSGDYEIGNYINQLPAEVDSFFEYVLEQIHLNYRETDLRKSMIYLAGFLDSNGYLTISLEKAAVETGADYIQMLDALTLIQQLEPAGIGARDLQECLMLQTERIHDAPPLAYIVLEEYFKELSQRKWQKIAKAYQISLKEVQEIFDFIQKLDPAPGSQYVTTETAVITPELRVKVNEEELELTSLKKGLSVHFQQEYFQQLEKAGDAETSDYLKEKKAQYQWLRKTLKQRSDTIYLVGRVIVEHQKDFFLKQNGELKPLALKDVAKETGLHESTVSRAVNGKYLETAFGVFELKSFFSNRSSKQNEDLSAEAAKKKILQLIEEEDKRKPLSDQKIVDLLKEQDIILSRRTVAKYREALKIPGSSKRKRFED